MRGQMVDVHAIVQAGQDEIAVGNGGTRYNARGDILGKNGKVIKKREDIQMEYAQSPDAVIKTTGLKALDQEILTVAEVAEKLKPTKPQPEATPETPAMAKISKRKIKETDEI